MKTKTLSAQSAFLLTLLVMIFFGTSAKVNAAYQITTIDPGTQRDFVVGPGKQELTLKAGQTVTINLTVANRLGVKKTFNIDMEDVSGSRDLDRPVILLDNSVGPYSLKNYLSVPEKTVTLENGQKAIVPVTISVPQDSEPGGLYGSVVVSTVSDANDSNNQGGQSTGSNQIVTRIGTLFFIRVDGDVQHSGIVSDFYVKGNQSVFASGPVTFDILYDNKGDIHEAPVGVVKINNMFGSEVGIVDVDTWFALPRSLRLREVSWDSPFLIGRYVATANIYPGYGSATTTLSTVFWVIPWKHIVALIVILALGIFIIRLMLSKFSITIKSK